jgi:amino acid transporter
MGRRGLVSARVGQIHPRHQTPAAAVLWMGIATAACMLLGDAILVPITEVGSVACALGWSATCAACLSLGWRKMRGNIPSGTSAQSSAQGISLSTIERGIATAGLLVGIAMVLMKVIPLVPGHFTVYEWVALAAWIVLGAILRRREAASV